MRHTYAQTREPGLPSTKYNRKGENVKNAMARSYPQIPIHEGRVRYILHFCMK